MLINSVESFGFIFYLLPFGCQARGSHVYYDYFTWWSFIFCKKKKKKNKEKVEKPQSNKLASWL